MQGPLEIVLRQAQDDLSLAAQDDLSLAAQDDLSLAPQDDLELAPWLPQPPTDVDATASPVSNALHGMLHT
jgi:hypothetical protein